MTNAGTGHLTPVRSDAESAAVREAITRLKDYLTSQIVGQDKLVERLLVALLADGHLLVEGARSRRSHMPWKRTSSACNSRPICCPRT
jgi:hypothetical protein